MRLQGNSMNNDEEQGGRVDNFSQIIKIRNQKTQNLKRFFGIDNFEDHQSQNDSNGENADK